MNPLKEFSLATQAGREVKVSIFGEVPYDEAYSAMSTFAMERSAEQADQIWLVQHPPVYTQGTACDLDSFLPSDIPTVKTDRGGQITYHGPGQIVMYPMLDLKQHGMGVKSLVAKLEQCVIDELQRNGISATRRDDAPGVYVDSAKIAALGLRIRRGTSYHGLSFNVAMDLTPFRNIDPCGYQGLEVTQLSDLLELSLSPTEVGVNILRLFVDSL